MATNKNKKALRIILIIVGASLLYTILALAYLIPHRKQMKQDNWYQEEVKQLAIKYASQIDDSEYELKCLGSTYTYGDEAEEIRNRNRELPEGQKEYPFSQVEIEVLAGPQIYVLHLEKDALGELKLLSYEVKKNNKYFY